VLFKIILILGFVWFGGQADSSYASSATPIAPLALMGVSLGWVSFSYSGWNAGHLIGSEVTHPERNLPRSLLLGTSS